MTAPWREQDSLLAVALQLHEESVHPDCGHYVDEAFDPANDVDNPDGTHRFYVDPPHRCHACTAIAREVEKYAKSPQSRALQFAARLVPRRRRKTT